MRETAPAVASTQYRKPGVARVRRSSDLAAALMLAPFMIAFVLFFIFPMVTALHLSFTASSLTETGRFVGLDNYSKLLRDTDFWASLYNTGRFALYTIIPTAAIALLMALGVHRLHRAKNVALAFFFLPFVLPVSVVTLLWQWILNGSFGIVNALTGSTTLFFSQISTAMPTIAVVTIWWTVGFKMLLFLAGLQNIPRETYEAAAVDGARGFQVFRFITWPLLWPITTLVISLQLIASLKVFSQVYILTAGGPFNSTRVVLQYMYETAFQNLNAGYASTIAIAFFVIVMMASLLQATLLARRS